MARPISLLIVVLAVAAGCKKEVVPRADTDFYKKTQEALLHGSGDDAMRFTYDVGMRSYQTTKPFEGVVTNLERRWRETMMYHAGNDRWVGHVELDGCGTWEFTVAAWVDRFASWRQEASRG